MSDSLLTTRGGTPMDARCFGAWRGYDHPARLAQQIGPGETFRRDAYLVALGPNGTPADRPHLVEKYLVTRSPVAMEPFRAIVREPLPDFFEVGADGNVAPIPIAGEATLLLPSYVVIDRSSGGELRAIRIEQELAWSFQYDYGEDGELLRIIQTTAGSSDGPRIFERGGG